MMHVKTCNGDLYARSIGRTAYRWECSDCGWSSPERASPASLAKIIGIVRAARYCETVKDVPHVRATVPPEMVNGLRLEAFFFPHMETMEAAFARMAKRVKEAEKPRRVKWWLERDTREMVSWWPNGCAAERFDDEKGEWVPA